MSDGLPEGWEKHVSKSTGMQDFKFEKFYFGLSLM
jgi:hypothetical protein